MRFEKEKKSSETFKKIFEDLFSPFNSLSNCDKPFHEDTEIYVMSRNRKFEVVAKAGCCSLQLFKLTSELEGPQQSATC